MESQEMSELVSDSQFLNKIQNDVNSWIKDIQKVTLLTRDPSNGTTRQEIEFWLCMERSNENARFFSTNQNTPKPTNENASHLKTSHCRQHHFAL